MFFCFKLRYVNKIFAIKRSKGLVKHFPDGILFTSESHTFTEENFLLVRATLQGKRLIFGAIYGPNDYNPNFFQKLENGIRSLGDYPVILGGDWNCTYSLDPIEHNIDCLNMARLSNLRHTELLRAKVI